ncbi:PAS domain-containing protein [Roseospira marina]|uniref:PAS domain-containing protein n=1 Tax=Roseospira marina TaxID=140057 RepID=A0A5M6I9S1_9PROT|nr:methyl-accepting chemotaxis protein [Roseospira marina]KAA5604475.1 PAS domain-containing protein [Roseospira marina]MBB4315522.1 aerotaxis receptor [Roseospira marina]MBB5088541.1 aerotaxis receptor [Roseospira marina]
MRVNEPVTQKEIDYPDDRCLVSRTDLKGKIVFVNDDFIAVAGYSRDEMMGRPHNIVRHPDMPPSVFRDMWDTIKQGLPWEGIVKNRAKSGDHYWVRANVTPVVENGAVVEYISVRTKPSRADIDAAAALYKAINSNTAGRLTVREGQVVDLSLMGRAQRLSRSVLNRTIAGFAVVLALMVAQFGMVLSEAGPNTGNLVLISALLLAATALVSAMAAFGVAAGMRGPMAEVEGHLDRFALRDFSQVVTPSPIKEFTRITLLLNAVRAHLTFARQEQQELQLIARRQREEALRGMATAVESESNAAVEKVAEHSQAMRANAEAMAEGARVVSQNASTVAAAANQSQASAHTVAAAGEELTSSIREIRAQVRRTADVTRSAVDRGSETGAILDSMTAEVGQISDIAELIQAIASKTNLLALNASIEAARAGDAGKGFAVVAEEVKALANQTAASTKRITDQLQSVTAVTERAVTAVNDIVTTVREIDTVANAIAEAMESQAEATHEISRGVSEASTAAEDVARQIQIVSDEAGTTEARSQDLIRASADVAAAVTHLKGAVVQAIRTSTEETNRRQYERFTVSAPVKVHDGHQTRDGELIDISAGGALLKPLPSLAVGTRVSISAPRSSMAWDGKVVALGPEGVHIAFHHTHDIDVDQLRRAGLHVVT